MRRAVAAPGILLLNHPLIRTSPRLTYGLSHLAGALAAIALAGAVSVVLFPVVCRVARSGQKRWMAGASVAALFCVFWLPPWLEGGLMEDDWRLLAAASIRKSVELRSWISLRMLDTVDGNFRPLGTVLFFGYIMRWCGVAAHVFTAGPLLMTLLSAAVAYAIVRELGYTRAAAGAACVLFFSRGMLYTVATWAAALGDGLAICLCGLSALLILKACRRSGWRAAGFNGLAWMSFLLATLAKQSAFVMPLIVALLLWMRPGGLPERSRGYRAGTALAGLAVYGATAAAVFWYAKSLMSHVSPYPMALTAEGMIRPLAYLTWYFVLLELPDRFGNTALVSGAVGAGLVGLGFYLVRRFRRLLGDRPGDVGFSLLAAVASLTILVPLETRAAPYYGCMFAFWLSVGLGIALTRDWGEERDPSGKAGRNSLVVLCLLVFSGFASVRLEQIGIIASGGYAWGTFTSYTDRQFERYVRQELASAPQARTVLFQNCGDYGSAPAMVLLDGPGVERILRFDGVRQQYFANDREGLRPQDDVAGRTDPWMYNWTAPMEKRTAEALLAGGDVLRIPCRDEYYVPDAGLR